MNKYTKFSIVLLTTFAAQYNLFGVKKLRVCEPGSYKHGLESVEATKEIYDNTPYLINTGLIIEPSLMALKCQDRSTDNLDVMKLALFKECIKNQKNSLGVHLLKNRLEISSQVLSNSQEKSLMHNLIRVFFSQKSLFDYRLLPPVFRILFNYGILDFSDINYQDSKGNTVLHLLAMYSNGGSSASFIAKLMKEAEFNFNTENNEGKNCIEKELDNYFIQFGQLSEFQKKRRIHLSKFYLTYYPEACCKYVNNKGLLQHIVYHENNCIELINLMLTKTINLQKTTNSGNTIFHRCALLNNYELLSLFLSHAKKEKLDLKSFLHKVNNEGKTPYGCTTDSAIRKLLEEHGLSISFKPNRFLIS